MATHSRILAWRIPWTEEPGGLQSMESQRISTTELLSMRANTHAHTIHIDKKAGGAQRVCNRSLGLGGSRTFELRPAVQIGSCQAMRLEERAPGSGHSTGKSPQAGGSERVSRKGKEASAIQMK